MTSDNLNHLLKGPVSKYHCILRPGDLGLEHMNLGGGGSGNTVQLITQNKSQVGSPEYAFAGVALRAQPPTSFLDILGNSAVPILSELLLGLCDIPTPSSQGVTAFDWMCYYFHSSYINSPRLRVSFQGLCISLLSYVMRYN